MRLVFSLFIFFLMVFTVSKASQYADDIQRIVKKGTLVVAMLGEDMPPFFMNINGELVGIDVDIAKSIAKALNVQVEFNRQAKSFDEVITIVARNEADVGISKLSFTLERAKIVLYTDYYVLLRKGFLINRLFHARIKSKRKADTLNEIFSRSDSVMGVIDKSSYVRYAQMLFPASTIVNLPSWDPDILAAVVEGKVLGAFRDELEIKKFLLLNPEANLRVMPLILKNQEDPLHMVVPPGHFHFRDWLNGYLQATKTTFSVDSLLSKYGSYFEQKRSVKAN
jgi:ABC-type amino acid transport substrate-binding protein